MDRVGIKLNSCARTSVGGRRPGFDSVREPSLDHGLSEMIRAAVREALAEWPAGAGPEPLVRLVAQALQSRLEKPAASQGQRSHLVGPIDSGGEGFLSPSELAKRWHVHVETARRMLRRRQLSSVLVARHRLVPVSEVERFEREGLVARLQP